jgi:hypothetical protein
VKIGHNDGQLGGDYGVMISENKARLESQGPWTHGPASPGREKEGPRGNLEWQGPWTHGPASPGR